MVRGRRSVSVQRERRCSRRTPGRACPSAKCSGSWSRLKTPLQPPSPRTAGSARGKRQIPCTQWRRAQDQGELLVVGQAGLAITFSTMHREFIIHNVHELRWHRPQQKYPPWNRYGSFKFNVSVTHLKTGTLSVRRIETTQSGLVQVHRCRSTSFACGPQQPGKPTWNNTPSTNMWPSGITSAKQLDVYNTSQPLPSSLTEVHSDPHLLGRGCSWRTTWSDNQLHHAAKQLDDRMPQQTPTPMPTPVTPTQIQRAHPFRTPTDVHAKQWRFQSSNRWQRRRIKIDSLPREHRPLLFAVQPTIACLTWSPNTRTDASEFRMIKCS